MMKAAHPDVVAATRVNPGDTLRQGREEKNWSLPEVASRLNLTVASLGNVEAGHFEKLPGNTFARGYIRAYAKLLGLDQTVLVQQFDQYTGTDSHGSNVHSLGRIEEPVRLSHNILRIVSLLLLVVLIGGGFFWWQDQSSMRGKEAVGTTIEHVEVESADGTTQIHPLDEPEDLAVADAQGSRLALPLPSATQVVDPAGALLVQPATVTPAAGSPAAVAPAATSSAAATAVATTPVSAAVAGTGSLTLRYSADCWTQVTDGNGKVVLSGVKHKGENLDVSGKPPFTVRLGFARGVQLSYNGQPVDLAPFTSGETVRLTLGQ